MGNNLVGTEIRVLDKGVVKLIDCTDNPDGAVVRSARVSYGGTGSKGEEADRKLINYMLDNSHSSPFEHNSISFYVKAPLLVFRQWHRTRIGVSYNEISARYTEMKDEFYVPDKWRAQDTKNKQGSIEAPELDHLELSHQLAISCAIAMDSYRRMLAKGVAREMARMVLPVNLYSEMYFTCNLRSLMAFATLRSENHAQWETREFSNAMALIFREWAPWTYTSFCRTLDLSEYPGFPEPIGVSA